MSNLKVKALELYNKFLQFTPVEFEHSYTKKCALIAVDELIKSWNEDLYENCGASIYWQEVKQEINNL